ncbi:hypothetical protein H9K76_11405 [Diaphorobacter ruginosibacter]|jgi:hypothetical protein|uniref:Phasin family protein n=1 Tax=Diaphorobacter ruginosibacter TaxID=1715720 RepID=A0A7G9RUQ5_9BURK|nr:hypothetical protein [Diaphorobacter ruginosibacter]MDR2335242.1 hypothetical protein [Burkholderiaceae bacterium]QNN59330.1 hypothetical protein H9K76_11405 [Diaphorobacter ruginosibacter]
MAARKKTPSATRQLAELSIAAPNVIAHRVTRMAMASPTHPSRRDQKEFIGMVQEKQVAFAKAWWTLSLEISKAQQAFFWSMLRGPQALTQQVTQMPQTLERITARSVAPIHRKAVQNSRRLSKTPLR